MLFLLAVVVKSVLGIVTGLVDACLSQTVYPSSLILSRLPFVPVGQLTVNPVAVTVEAPGLLSDRLSFLPLMEGGDAQTGQFGGMFTVTEAVSSHFLWFIAVKR